jgi:hypothetical protein
VVVVGHCWDWAAFPNFLPFSAHSTALHCFVTHLLLAYARWPGPQVVYAQVSQENIPLGPLATLMPLLQMAGVLNDPNMKSVLKSTRDCQENLAVLDRSHSIKVCVVVVWCGVGRADREPEGGEGRGRV